MDGLYGGDTLIAQDGIHVGDTLIPYDGIFRTQLFGGI